MNNLYNDVEKALAFDDKFKRFVIGRVMKTSPLTVVFLAAIGVGFLFAAYFAGAAACS